MTPPDARDRRRHATLRGLAAVALAAVLGTFAMLLWFLFLDPVTPLERTEMVRIEVENPADGSPPFLVVTRRFCFSRPSEAEVFRRFTRLDGAGEMGEVREAAAGRIHLEGPPCYTRPRVIDLPPGIGPGRWRYQAGLRWTNATGRAVTVWTSPVEFDLDLSGGGRRIVNAQEVR